MKNAVIRLLGMAAVLMSCSYSTASGDATVKCYSGGVEVYSSSAVKRWSLGEWAAWVDENGTHSASADCIISMRKIEYRW